MTIELVDQNFTQTGQLNSLFHASTEVVNRVGARQNTDWLMPNSVFSPSASCEFEIHPWSSSIRSGFLRFKYDTSGYDPPKKGAVTITMGSTRGIADKVGNTKITISLKVLLQLYLKYAYTLDIMIHQFDNIEFFDDTLADFPKLLQTTLSMKLIQV